MNKVILVGLILFLTGCGGNPFTPKTELKVVTSYSYPELLDLPKLPPLNLKSYEVDIPRKTDELVVKNLSTCISVPEEDRKTEQFKNTCLENPVDTDSNILFGFDTNNWNILVENINKLRERIYLHEQREIQVNKQRQEWRDLAEKEKLKTK